jgi:hypothetical protein
MVPIHCEPFHRMPFHRHRDNFNCLENALNEVLGEASNSRKGCLERLPTPKKPKKRLQNKYRPAQGTEYMGLAVVDYEAQEKRDENKAERWNRPLPVSGLVRVKNEFKGRGGHWCFVARAISLAAVVGVAHRRHFTKQPLCETIRP